MDNNRTDQDIRMFAVQQMAIIFQGNASVPFHFLPCTEVLVEYIKTGSYPIYSNEGEK